MIDWVPPPPNSQMFELNTFLLQGFLRKESCCFGLFDLNMKGKEMELKEINENCMRDNGCEWLDMQGKEKKEVDGNKTKIKDMNGNEWTGH